MEDIVLKWNRPTDKSFFKGHDKISLKPEDYQVKGHTQKSLDETRKRKLRFQDDFIDYAFLLLAPKKNKLLDAALIGFKLEDKLIDCRQIQGCHGRYRELVPIQWNRALLNSLKEFGQNYEFEEIHIPMYLKVKGCDWDNADNLKRIYDRNAQSLGFKYSDDLESWIFEF